MLGNLNQADAQALMQLPKVAICVSSRGRSCAVAEIISARLPQTPRP
jgi:hypothetical protein